MRHRPGSSTPGPELQQELVDDKVKRPHVVKGKLLSNCHSQGGEIQMLKI